MQEISSWPRNSYNQEDMITISKLVLYSNHFDNNIHCYQCRIRDSNPYTLWALVPKTSVSTNSTNPAHIQECHAVILLYHNHLLKANRLVKSVCFVLDTGLEPVFTYVNWPLKPACLPAFHQSSMKALEAQWRKREVSLTISHHLTPGDLSPSRESNPLWSIICFFHRWGFPTKNLNRFFKRPVATHSLYRVIDGTRTHISLIHSQGI